MFCSLSSSEAKPFSQIASFVAADTAMYSASVLERASVGCRLLAHEIAAPDRLKKQPVQDLLLSTSETQSASQYPDI